MQALAERIALEAGQLLVDRLADARTAIETKSSPTDMVSEVDRASEELIIGRILAARPDDGILGEEGASRAGISGVRWVVDPLDGTTNYLYRIPAFAVSIGVERNGERVAGVVYDPSRVEMFSASNGGGAHRNGLPLAVGSVADPGVALCGTGFAYAAAMREHQGAMVANVLPRVRDIRRSGSAALDLCWVACGRLDTYFEANLMPWDCSAGMLIVEEAGGRCEQFETRPGMLITLAANTELLPKMRALLTSAV